MEHMSARKVDITKNDTSVEIKSSFHTGNNKQEVSKQEFPSCHKVTGSQSSIDHDKSDVKRSSGHRSKSFLEEPIRSKTANFLQSKHGDSSNRSTHGSHGDGINSKSSNLKGVSVNEQISRNGDQHKSSESEKPDIFQAQGTGSTQKLFDPELTFADLVRVYATPTSKTGTTKYQVGNVLLSNTHVGTVVSNYLNTYRCYLAHLRSTGVFGTTVRDPCRSQSTPASNVPLVLPLSCMTPVFSDDSRNDPEFVDLLKKTTTESIRNLWPCRRKTNIFSKTGNATERTGTEESSLITLQDSSEEFEGGDESSHEEDDCNTATGEKENCCFSTCQVPVSEACKANKTLSVNNSDHMSNLNFGLTVLPSHTENVFGVDQTGAAFSSSKLSPTHSSSDDMVKTMTDNFHTYPASSAALQVQTNSACWSEATEDTDSHGEGKTAPNKASHLNKLLQLQQKLLHQHHIQRQFIHLQQRQQHHHQQQQQHQMQAQPEQLLQQFQNKPKKDLEQQQQQPHQHQHEQQQQKQQQQNNDMQFEKRELSAESKPWYQVGSDASYNCESGHASLSTGTQLTSVHTLKSEYQPSLQGVMNGYENLGEMTGQVGFHVANLPSFTPSRSEVDSHHPEMGADTPVQLRTLKASYACLDPQQPNSMLSADHLFGPLNENCPIKLGSKRLQSQPFNTEPFGERFSGEDNGASWLDLNSKNLAGFHGDDGIDKIGLGKDNGWGSTGDTSVQERLKRAYARTKTNQCVQGGAWSGFSTSGSQHMSNRPSNDAIFGGDMATQGLHYQDQTAFCGVLGNQVGGGGGTEISSKSQSSFSQMPEVPETFDVFGYSGDGSQGQMGESHHFRHLAPTDQGSRMSRLYQWRSDANTQSSAASRSLTGASGNELNINTQGDQDFSWNASPLPPPLETADSMQSVNGGSHSMGVGEVPVSCMDGSTSLGFGRKHQLNPETAPPFDPFRGPSHDLGQASMLLDRQVARQQQPTWSINGMQPSERNARTSQAPHLGCGPLLSHSMQVLNNKILSAQNASARNDGTTESQTSKDEGTFPITPVAPSNDMNKTRQNRILGINEKVALGDQTCLNPITMPMLQSQQQQQQQPQQQNIKQNSLLSLSEELEKTYLGEDLVSTPWHEMASEETTNNDFQADYSMKKPAQHYLSTKPLAFVPSSQQKDRCSHNNADSGVGKEQGKQTGQQRPRLILGANSAQNTKPREGPQSDNNDDNSRRLREILGLNPSDDQLSKQIGQGFLQQDSIQAQQQPSTGIMAGHLLANNTMNGQGARLQHPTSMQSSMPMGHQMYCVPNILMPPPQAQTPNTSRPSSLMLGGVNSSTRFPGMIRVPYVDMSRVVYIQQMPVNVASSQPSNNNHNNSTSSNPHVNVSNIITINTDKDFGNGGQGDKPGRILRQNMNKNKTTFLKVRSGSEEFAVPILGMRPSLDDNGFQRPIKPRTNPWDQDLDQDFNSSLLSKAKAVEQVTSLGPLSGDCINGSGEQSKTAGLGGLLGGGSSLGGTPTGSESNLHQTATFMQWPASADMHPEMLDMLPVRRAAPEEHGMGGRLCWPDMEFMLSSRDQLQNTRRSNKPMGSNKANLISIIPRGGSNEGPGGSNSVQKDLENSLVA